VNEENCIGGQTFSIQEIQEEWRLSLTALTVAMEEYTLNLNGGREKSLLASMVGLTTRYTDIPSSPTSFSFQIFDNVLFSRFMSDIWTKS
jgi:hypothetical protein